MRRIINKEKICKTVSLAIFIATVLASGTLFYRYIYHFSTSDYLAHIESSLEHSTYSINILLIPFFYNITGSNFGIVIMMSVLIVGTIIGTTLLIKKLANQLYFDVSFFKLLTLSCSLLFICKICIPEWSPYFYYGSFVTQPWHNSTYINMRLFAIITLLFYYTIRKEYIETIRLRDCLFFTFFLFLTNFAKPNFLLSFAPTMLIILIFDFIKTKGRSFKNAFVFGFCVLITVAIVYYQYTILFPSSGDGKVVVSIKHAVDYFTSDKKTLLYFVLNYCFPLYTSFLVSKNYNKIDSFSKRLFFEMWIMNIISILISLFVTETGKRALDGNFEWSNPFFAYTLFIVCIVLLMKMKKDDVLSVQQITTARNIFFIHIITGIFYFMTLLLGYLSWAI